MRKALALSAILLLVAAGTYAQVRTSGKGLSKPTTSALLSLVPADQYLTTTFVWDKKPAGTDDGWGVAQSTASGVTLRASAGTLLFDAQTADRRAVIYDLNGAGTGMSQTMTTSGRELLVAFAVSGLTVTGNSTTGWFQYGYGDTTNFVASKVPDNGFGIIVTGSTNANNAYAQANRVTGYTADGLGDTTYTPLPVAISDPMKFWIHMRPDGSTIDFWVNGVLVQTMTLPSGQSNALRQSCFWVNGATSENVYLGPLTIQRAWP